jgi:hypothetical protein
MSASRTSKLSILGRMVSSWRWLTARVTALPCPSATFPAAWAASRIIAATGAHSRWQWMSMTGPSLRCALGIHRQ